MIIKNQQDVTAAVLAVLNSLGMWQVQRLAWKQDLIARIDAARGVGDR